MNEVKLNLNVVEVNTIIKALGQFPYNQVNDLIVKIHQQASVQLTEGNGQENGQEIKEEETSKLN